MNVNKNMRVLRKRKNKGNNVNIIEQIQKVVRKTPTHIRIATDVKTLLAEEMQKRGKKNTNRFVNRVLRGWLKKQARLEAQAEVTQ